MTDETTTTTETSGPTAAPAMTKAVIIGRKVGMLQHFRPDGSVVGVVFSRSAADPNIGYALASPGVLSRVHQAESTNNPSGTGSCAG